MNELMELPEPSTFGYDHNYAAWAPNSRVTLCRVKWNSSYRDIVRFPGANPRQALNDYIDNAGAEYVTVTDAVYLKFGQPIDLDIPFSKANTVNYLRVHNPSQPIFSPGGADNPTDFYYFVSNVEYIAPNATRFHVQLDVWQTFAYEFVFGNCFIERSHNGIAASNAFDEYGRAWLNIPEGIDIGGEYNIAYNWSHRIGTARGSDTDYGVLIMTTADLSGPIGTKEDPGMNTATGSIWENLPSGASIYMVDISNFTTFMRNISDKPWISSCIISINAIPADAIERYEINASPAAISFMPEGTVKQLIVGSIHNPTMVLEDNWRERALTKIPVQYRHLLKLLTFPYMAIEMTTYSGQPIIIKPESWDNPHAMVAEVPHLVPGSARIVFYPVGYNRAVGHNAVEDAMGIVNDGGEFLDAATSISNFPSFSIVNNSHIAYMASNRNSIAFQHQSADWSQQRALTGNQLSFDQASAGMDLTNKLNDLNINAATQNAGLSNQTAMFNNLQGAGNSVINAGSPMQGAMGVLNAGINQAISTNHTNQTLNISTHQQNASTNASVANSSYMANTNLAYANYAARGDYQNSIAGIAAKVQDSKLLQPTTSGQVGGDAFNLAKYQWGVDLKLKVLQGAALNQVAGYFMRFGYQMNMWGTLPADLHCMTHFTYWKLRETYVASSKAPEAFKETIRGIFEKGVTVWRNPDDIGNIDMTDNLPIEGITL